MNKPDKGKRGGSCNMTRCQAPDAWFYNRGSYSWYCEDCALVLNRANPEPFADGKPMVIHVPPTLTEKQVCEMTKHVSWKGEK